MTLNRREFVQLASVSAESDWTTRVLVGHLKPARVYRYRFPDEEAHGSRVGRALCFSAGRVTHAGCIKL